MKFKIGDKVTSVVQNDVLMYGKIYTIKAFNIWVNDTVMVEEISTHVHSPGAFVLYKKLPINYKPKGDFVV